MISKIKKKKLNEFFPSEDNPKSIVDNSDVEYLSYRLNKFYPIIIKKFNEVYKDNFDKQNLEIILRRCLVPMTYIFFERCIRSINSKKKVKLSDKYYDFDQFYKIEDFERISSFSIDFNYYLNHNFLNILNDKKVKSKKKIKVKDDFESLEQKEKKNYLPIYYNDQKKILNFFLRKFEKIANYLYYNQKILTLGTANSEPALVNKAFYISNLARFSDIKYDKKNYNLNLRNKIFYSLDNFFGEFKKVLKRYKLSINQLKSLYKFYNFFLKKNFPKFFLEDFEENYVTYHNFVREFKKKIIISSDNDDSLSTLIFLIAKNLNFKNIKFQHGGHYGYVDDNAFFNEIEFKNCDEFLTYGWKKKLDNSCNNKVNFLIMPSPWLSEKKKYFKAYDLKLKKKFDFIYFPQFIKPFTNGVQGSSNFRRDVIYNYLKNLLDICKRSKYYNSKIGIKFYNKTTELFLNQTIKKINYKYKTNIKFLSFHDKGISKYILSQTNLIIFDQIGTGVLECFNYGIPVMIIHNKDYNKPNKYAQKYFNKLQKAGVLHTNLKSLFNEYLTFKDSPEIWMANKKRKSSIKTFCNKFALTDVNWSIRFRNYLNDL